MYDLLREPWLPCIDMAGEPVSLGIVDALAQAHHLRELSHPSPLVTTALHRLLLAVLHRVFEGPRDADEWAGLWRGRAFARSRLVRALDPEQFDLFHPSRPFFQHAGVPAAFRPRPVLALAHEDSLSGATPELFDDRRLDGELGITPAAAARLVVAFQAYALGGLTSRLPGENPSATGAPLVKCAAVLVVGRTLFETLVLNLTGHAPHPLDLPAWESPPPEPITRPAAGWLDYLTWQSRRLRLLPPPADEELVRHVQIGRGLDLSGEQRSWERFAAWRYAAKTKVWLPLGMREDRAGWRDLTALLTTAAGETGRRPYVLDWIAHLRAEGHLADVDLGLAVAGMVTDRYKVLLWRRECLPLPLSALVEEAGAEALERALTWAESAGGVVRRLAGEQSVGAYWARLGLRFHRVAARLDEAEGLAEWQGAIRGAAWHALGALPTVGDLKTQVITEMRMRASLRRLFTEDHPEEDGDDSAAA